ncbi:MAG: hypothetical protein Ct9H300mP7_4430 [Verrucomicrobiota bacterium]|nr:MAG: hypothetical protein Ct9H300mP7_4430 [Verrucomicrobiota bacterium]
MIFTGAGGEEEYTDCSPSGGGVLAKAFDGNAAEMVHITNKPEDTGARKGYRVDT